MMSVRTIRSKVAGVTFRNNDGSNRQRIIARFCRNGKQLDVRLEPDNPYSKNAIGLWVWGKRLFIIPAQYQIGYFNDEIATEIRELIEEGWGISVRILEVTGGQWFRKRNYGVNIEIGLENNKDVAFEEKRRSSARKRSHHSVVASVSTDLPSSTLSRSLMAYFKGGLCWLGRSARRNSMRLLETYSALSRTHKLIFGGSCLCVGGVAFWTLGYLLGSDSGSFFMLRPVGVVTVIVGLGTLSLGTVFSLTEPSR